MDKGGGHRREHVSASQHGSTQLQTTSTNKHNAKALDASCSCAALAPTCDLRAGIHGYRSMKKPSHAVQSDGRVSIAPMPPDCKAVAKRPAASCVGGCSPRSGPWRRIGGREPRPRARAWQRPKPAAPARTLPQTDAQVSVQGQKCAVVVLVQCCGDVFWSVHRWCARVCARARVCACALHVLPNEPTHAGNCPPVVELHSCRTSPRAAMAPMAQQSPSCTASAVYAMSRPLALGITNSANK